MRQLSEDIDREVVRQTNQWGSQENISKDRWFTIMMEELGEASRAHLHEEVGRKVDMSSYQELIQLTAILHRALQVWNA